MEMMDGQIEVKSGKGKGTTFTLTLTFDKSEIEESSDAAADDTLHDAGLADKSLEGKRVLFTILSTDPAGQDTYCRLPSHHMFHRILQTAVQTHSSWHNQEDVHPV